MDPGEPEVVSTVPLYNFDGKIICNLAADSWPLDISDETWVLLPKLTPRVELPSLPSLPHFRVYPERSSSSVDVNNWEQLVHVLRSHGRVGLITSARGQYQFGLLPIATPSTTTSTSPPPPPPAFAHPSAPLPTGFSSARAYYAPLPAGIPRRAPRFPAVLPGLLPQQQMRPAAHTAPGQVAPGQMAPAQVAPGQMAQQQMRPAHTAPGQMAPGQMPPGLQHSQVPQRQAHSQVAPAQAHAQVGNGQAHLGRVSPAQAHSHVASAPAHTAAASPHSVTRMQGQEPGQGWAGVQVQLGRVPLGFEPDPQVSSASVQQPQQEQALPPPPPQQQQQQHQQQQRHAHTPAGHGSPHAPDSPGGCSFHPPPPHSRASPRAHSLPAQSLPSRSAASAPATPVSTSAPPFSTSASPVSTSAPPLSMSASATATSAFSFKGALPPPPTLPPPPLHPPSAPAPAPPPPLLPSASTMPPPPARPSPPPPSPAPPPPPSLPPVRAPGPGMHPQYLASLAHTHQQWVFGGLAELIDNSMDAKARRLDIFISTAKLPPRAAAAAAAATAVPAASPSVAAPPIPSSSFTRPSSSLPSELVPVLHVCDDGKGMDHGELVQMLSLGHDIPAEEDPHHIGRFGVGFK
ncbi:unnamed protein product, partial [Closterium sp. NIES-54]